MCEAAADSAGGGGGSGAGDEGEGEVGCGSATGCGWWADDRLASVRWSVGGAVGAGDDAHGLASSDGVAEDDDGRRDGATAGRARSLPLLLLVRADGPRKASCEGPAAAAGDGAGL